ncbi:SRPBCC domain-containing protein [Sulfitobacter sp.]|uniref:SRPBCC domain-containing protein n=1 Tax=Sulfitobacter sp. TaxID=1903071 RepID=UPI00329A1B4D
MSDRAEKAGFTTHTFIRCTQDSLWAAMTDPTHMAASHFVAERVTSAEGDSGAMTFLLPGGTPRFTLRPITVTPKTEFEAGFEPHFFGPDAPSSRVVYEIEQMEKVCRLTVEHYEIPEGQEGVAAGWMRLVSSVKSYLETGTPIRMPVECLPV